MTALPLDVLSKIIGQLDPLNAADIISLRSLSLSSHSILHFAQMALFSEIGLLLHSHNPKSSLKQVMRLKDVVLMSSPHIAHCIRSFKLGLAVHKVRDLETVAPALEELERILPSLGNIRNFELRYTLWKDSNWQNKCLDWLSLSPGFCRAVGEVVNSPGLVRLRLGRVKNFPMSMLMDRAITIDLDIEQPYVIDIKVINVIPSSKPSAATFVDGDVHSSRHGQVRSYKIGKGSIERPYAISLPGFDYAFDFSNLQELCVFWSLTDDKRKMKQSVPSSPLLRPLRVQLILLTENSPLLVYNKEVSFSGLARTLLDQPLPNLTTLRIDTTRYFTLIHHGDPFYEISISLTSKIAFPCLKIFHMELYFWTASKIADSQAFLDRLNLPGKYVSQLDRLTSMPNVVFSCIAELY
ncbi:hypothetical protein CPB84DRAFT_1797124 [Gymnopilus junonius]|uniref:F-box domain-containing protein n=1 Tax=Gymnopilus junonius TaxID=109634 RepID=A0A9P5THA0_GYMJU|nr:hypothetical protein CPB84DRAFT_1797124 [Gymnopilus junonius]